MTSPSTLGSSPKTKIQIYSGHGEIIGGDVTYLVGLISSIDPARFDVSVCTDESPIFRRRVNGSYGAVDHIDYIDTRPVLFKKTIMDRIYINAYRRSASSGLVSMLFRVLSFPIGGRPAYRYLRHVWRNLLGALTFSWIRHQVTNVCVFRRLLTQSERVPDVFHFNNGGYTAKETGLIGIIVARALGIKNIIMTVHNLAAPRRWYQPSGYLFDLLVPRFCTHVIATCDAVRDSLIELRGFLPEKTLTLYCGLADQEPPKQQELTTARQELGVAQEAPLLMICANIDEHRKGHRVLFQALTKIVPNHPELRLLVVGGGTPEHEASLRDVATKLGLDDIILFLGFRTDATKLNAVSDIVVMPSIEFESIPYAVTEAMRFARPVVTTTAGGCQEAVEDAISGFVVPAGNVDRLAHVLETLITDTDTRDTMGRAARSLYLDRFMLGPIVKKTEALYLSEVAC